MFWKDIAQHSKSYAVLEVQYFEVLGYLPFRPGKPEIPVRRSNGSRHSVWEAS